LSALKTLRKPDSGKKFLQSGFQIRRIRIGNIRKGINNLSRYHAAIERNVQSISAKTGEENLPLGNDHRTANAIANAAFACGGLLADPNAGFRMRSGLHICYCRIILFLIASGAFWTRLSRIAGSDFEAAAQPGSCELPLRKITTPSPVVLG